MTLFQLQIQSLLAYKKNQNLVRCINDMTLQYVYFNLKEKILLEHKIKYNRLLVIFHA